MKPIYAMFLAGFLAAALHAAEPSQPKEQNEPKTQFTSKELGITLDPPAAKFGEAPAAQVASFHLPAEDEFSATVGIQKQAYADTLEAYDKLSVSQFEAMKWTVLKRTVSKDAIVYEYKGDFQGRELHWYAKAIKKGDTVFLATAVALDSSWEKQKAELIKSVDSLKLTAEKAEEKTEIKTEAAEKEEKKE